MLEKRINSLVAAMMETDLDICLITDEDAIYYFTGYYDYLHMAFGRPTILVIERDGSTVLITPAIDYNTASDTAQVDHIRPWNDGMGAEWREHLLSGSVARLRVGVEALKIPALVRNFIRDNGVADGAVVDIEPILADMRMVKSEQELDLARHAGEVANAMMDAGRRAIAPDVAEFEVALATSEAGTRKAAELLQAHYQAGAMSPNTHFLQIMASGPEITRTHHRASTRIMKRGEPVFLCFCGMTNFHRFKLGFDRTFWIGEIAEKSQAEIYEVAVASQSAALAELRIGAVAEDVHKAYAEVIQSAGYEYPFRCGRGTGFSFLERPQLVYGDKTILRAGMVLAVDGSVNTDGFRAQVGDSFILTETGPEALTCHDKALQDVTIV